MCKLQTNDLYNLCSVDRSLCEIGGNDKHFVRSVENVPSVMWEEAYLSSIIRAQQAIPSLPGMRVIASHPLMCDQAFMHLAAKFFWDGTFLHLLASQSHQHPSPTSIACHLHLSDRN